MNDDMRTYTKKEDLIFLHLKEETTLDKLKPGDFFAVELRPQLTSNAKPDEFYGELIKITNKTVRSYWIKPFNPFGRKYTIEDIRKSSFDKRCSYKPKTFHKKMIRKLYRVEIEEKYGVQKNYQANIPE